MNLKKIAMVLFLIIPLFYFANTYASDSALISRGDERPAGGERFDQGEGRYGEEGHGAYGGAYGAHPEARAGVRGYEAGENAGAAAGGGGAYPVEPFTTPWTPGAPSSGQQINIQSGQAGGSSAQQ